MMTTPTLDELIADLDDLDEPVDIAAALRHMHELYPDAREEIRQRLQARLDQSRDALARIDREVEREKARAARMVDWAAAERAKGRPRAELTWRNCVRETVILREGER